MEAAVRDKKTTRVEDELALKLGALILRCMGPQGGEVLRVIDESGVSFAQIKVLVELQTPTRRTPSRLWPSTSAFPRLPPAVPLTGW